MDRRFLIYMAVWACLCFSACSEHGDVLQDEMMESISLSAVVDEVKILSRGTDDDAYTGTVPSMDNELEAAVWFSLESGKYLSELPADASDEVIQLKQETNIPVHSEILYQSGSATFPKSISDADKPRYPINGQSVYCVGFYPKTDWSLTDATATKAQHAISGEEDLMFAPQISGSWNQHFTTQRYRHLLTWLKVCVCATSTEAGYYWGKLKKITLKDVPNTLTIDLSKAEGTSFNLQETVEYSSENRSIDILDSTDGIDLAITTQDVASVFCKPQARYRLSVECMNGKTTEIEIELKPLDADDPDNTTLLAYPAGLQYVLILYFHPYNVVEGVCTLNAWNAQNEDLYPNN